MIDELGPAFENAGEACLFGEDQRCDVQQPPSVALVGEAFAAGADLRSGRALDDLRGRGAHLIVQIAQHDEPSFGAATVEELVGDDPNAVTNLRFRTTYEN